MVKMEHIMLSEVARSRGKIQSNLTHLQYIEKQITGMDNTDLNKLWILEHRPESIRFREGKWDQTVYQEVTREN